MKNVIEVKSYKRLSTIRDNDQKLTRFWKHTMQRFSDKHRLKLDPANVPENQHAIIPFAEKWGMDHVGDLDDYEIRKILFAEASLEEIKELIETVSPYMETMENWLTGQDAAKQPISREYLAFTLLVMAYDDATRILRHKGQLPDHLK
jgi:hypothetical protein